MSLDGLFKRTLYWTNDLLHGGKIWNIRKDINSVMSDAESGKKKQDQKLKELLDWATKNSAFYSAYAGKSLPEFPVVNKLILVENHEANSVPKEKIPWQEGDIFIQKTSGSTGVPFAVPQDTRKRQRRIGALKYFNDTVGFKSHEKLGQCRIWTKWHAKSKKQIFWENIYPVQVAKLDDSKMAELVETIKSKKLFALRAYASWYDFLLDYLKRGKCTKEDLRSLKVCLSISEGLNPATKEGMMELAGIPIVETYADEEAGTLAHQRLKGTNFYLNHADYVFECLKMDSDEPAEYGELGRIVLTDLYNYSFPMIRYDTGDTAIFHAGTKESNGWPYIEKLFGRKMDMVFDSDGQPVHPMNFGRTLKNFDTIRQWQFVQNDQYKYTVKLEVSDESQLEKVVSELKGILGDKADISVELVNDIPLLTSGKRKPVVCEWKH